MEIFVIVNIYSCAFSMFFPHVKVIDLDRQSMNSQNGSIGHTGSGHLMHTVRHVYVLDHGHFTDIVSTLAI
jgi:hypothetical protein